MTQLRIVSDRLARNIFAMTLFYGVAFGAAVIWIMHT
jgi:hypothetical protein